MDVIKATLLKPTLKDIKVFSIKKNKQTLKQSAWIQSAKRSFLMLPICKDT